MALQSLLLVATTTLLFENYDNNPQTIASGIAIQRKRQQNHSCCLNPYEFLHLQCLYRFHKLAHADSSRQEIFSIPEHHVITVLAPGGSPPRASQFNLFPAVIVFQMLALGFCKDNLAALGHNHNVRVVLDIAVDGKAMSG